MRGWRALIAAALCSLGLHALAAPAVCPPPLPATSDSTAPKDRGLMWKATRDGRTLYLFGTLHVGKPQWRKLGPLTTAALRASDVLALEIDPNDPLLAQAMAELRHPQALAEPLQKRLQQAFERACLATEALAALHPVLQVSTLTVMEGRWLGMDTAYAMEQVLLSHLRSDTGVAAKSGNGGNSSNGRVIALESALQQLQTLVPADDAEAATVIDQGLQQLEDRSARRVLDRLAAAWERGDLHTLEDYGRWCECADSEADRAYLKKLNDERNTGLADGIEAQHKAGKRVFAAVGALHMTGALSLPRLLEQRGFKVERVPFRR